MKRFALEKKLLQQGLSGVIGVDEVGRGCLAGPVVAAAVYFPKQVSHPEWELILDSKLVAPVVREKLSAYIQAHAAWGIGMVAPHIIDKINIHHASLLAMRRAVHQLTKKMSLENAAVLVDGKFTIPQLDLFQQAIVKGDAEVHSIAAASLVAKVYRDNLMKQLHKKFPEYNFDTHKGYATKVHREAIREYGMSSVHRVTFCGNIG